jgi:hypothetical protein
MSAVNDMAMAGIRHMIRLESEQWRRYVEHLLADSPRLMKRAATKRLLAHEYGHVLLSPRGILVDALLGMTYQNITSVRTEFIRAPNGVDMMLRAWFCRRVVNTQTNVNNEPFKFDIFLPPQMATEELSSITNFIMFESNVNVSFSFNQ